MNDQKNFLKRWSQRKSEAANAPAAQPPDKTSSPAAEKPAGDAAVPAKTAAISNVDLAKLPPLESIGAGTDISVFLRRGVPPALARAALRRAWSADPAIRDFVGLSENSWDFNAPNSMAGFGTLDAAEIRRLAAQLFDQDEHSGELGHSSAGGHALAQPAPPQQESGPADTHEMRRAATETEAAPSHEGHGGTHSDKTTDVMAAAKSPATDAATQYQQQKLEYDSVILRRRHGGALPE